MVYKKQDWSSEAFRQINGVDYTCAYSLIIEMDNFRLTVAIVSIYKLDLKTNQY